MKAPKIDVIIPVLNEQESIAKVIQDIPSLVQDIIVCNNGSTDNTVQVAEYNGAIVVNEPIKGYGKACLKGMEYIANKSPEQQPDIVVFLDGDYSDYPEELIKVIQPILEDGMDIVIGSRAIGERESGSMMPQQIFGNWLATTLIRLFYGYKFTDLGPFRAIKYSRLLELNMVDENFGWTVELQVKAAKKKMKCTEVAVNYRNRIGESKVTGTIKGSVMAGYKILWTIFKYL